MDSTRVDKLVIKIKNHPVLSIFIVAGMTVIAASSFSDAFRNLVSTATDIIGPPEPASFSGYWVSQQSDTQNPTYFEFKTVKDRLYGKVWLTPTFYMQNPDSGIIDGKIEGHQFTFSTRHEFIKEFGTHNLKTGQRTPNIFGIEMHQYSGMLEDDSIQLNRIANGDYESMSLSKVSGFKIKQIGSGYFVIGEP